MKKSNNEKKYPLAMFRPDKQMTEWLAGKALEGESLGLTAKRLLGKQMRAESKSADETSAELESGLRRTAQIQAMHNIVVRDLATDDFIE